MPQPSPVITGVGCISCAGDGYDDTASSLFRQPVRPAAPIATGSSLELPVFELTGFKSENDKPGGRTLALLRHALEQALRQAALSRQELGSLRVGVCIGTTVACQLNNIPFYAELRSTGSAPAKPLNDFISGSPAEWIRREYSLCGPALTVSNACSSGTDAIGLASLWVRSGLCDIAIAGGADELNKVPIAGFHALGVCSKSPCRPFDRNRNGLNLGEGGAIVIMESAAAAKKRGGSPLFSVAGYGTAADGFHITRARPDGSGLAQAVNCAMESAGIRASEIAFVNAHGTGTDGNDRLEASVLIRIFGADVKYLSTKRMTGHTLGAAGALEFIFTGIMLAEGKAPPSHGFETLPDDIAVAPLTSEIPIAGKFAMSTSLAFGGCNSALIVERVG
ncbi:MAG: beta-ketoacyl-[acyl-carrier-protein] synthase family protein [Victivallales bacterium]|jgi:3-oxoacyl-(acyl-carrier-protein) synthase